MTSVPPAGDRVPADPVLDETAHDSRATPPLSTTTVTTEHVTTGRPAASTGGGSDAMVRDYHDARRREDQWRIPQLLLALATPLIAFIAALFALGGENDYAGISAAVATVTGAGAALLAVEVWRWHRTAIGIANRLRTDYPGDAALLLKDPL